MRERISSIALAVTLVSGPALAVSAEYANLTETQQQLIEKDVSRQPVRTTPPSFVPSVGAEVPPQLILKSLPDEVTTQIPSVKSYQFTKIQGKILLVDPEHRQIVAIID